MDNGMVYTTKRIGKILSVNEETVRRWLRSGDLYGTLNSKKQGYIILESEFMRFLNDHPKYRKRFDEYKENRKKKIMAYIKGAVNNLPQILEIYARQNYILSRLEEERNKEEA